MIGREAARGAQHMLDGLGMWAMSRAHIADRLDLMHVQWQVLYLQVNDELAQVNDELAQVMGQRIRWLLVRVEAVHAILGKPFDMPVQRTLWCGSRGGASRWGFTKQHHRADEFIHALSGIGEVQLQLLLVASWATLLAGHWHYPDE